MCIEAGLSCCLVCDALVVVEDLIGSLKVVGGAFEELCNI
jgi:hypothetical protein